MSVPPLPPPTPTGLNFTMDYDDISETNVTNDTGPFVQFANGFNIYYTPFLFTLGCTGNLMSIIVFYRSKLRFQSTSLYLTGLAVSDSVFLLMLLPPWLKATEISPMFGFNGFCQISVYFSYVTSNLSAWLVVAFTVERLVAVAYPLRRNAMCTVKRARHIVLSLALLALAINAPVLWFATATAGECNIDSELMEHAARFNILDTMLSFTVPLSIIVVLNIWITVCVYTQYLARRDLMREQEALEETGPVAAVAAIGRVSQGSATGGSQQRVTRMLLIVSSFFVMLNLPAYSMRIIAYASNMRKYEYTGDPAALQQICLLMFHSNFGINFVLYCMSGQNFRHALLQTFAPWMCRRRINLTVLGGTSQQAARASSISTSFRTTSVDSATQCSEVNGGGRCTPDDLPPPPLRQRGPTKYIKKWRFHNPPQRNIYHDRPSTSRTEQADEVYEMRSMYDRVATICEPVAGPSSRPASVHPLI